MQTTYFPDYDDTLPQIDGFVDASYGNDTCSDTPPSECLIK